MKILNFFLIVFFLLELVSESQENSENFRSNRNFRPNVKMIPLRRNSKRKSRSFLPLEVKKDKPPSAPTFKQEWPDPQVQTVHRYAAMTAVLNCSAKGWPKPKVVWYRNDVEITSSNDRP